MRKVRNKSQKNKKIVALLLVTIMAIPLFLNVFGNDFSQAWIKATEDNKNTLTVSANNRTNSGEKFQVKVTGILTDDFELEIPEGVEYLGQETSANSNYSPVMDQDRNKLMISFNGTKENTFEELKNSIEDELIFSFQSETAGNYEFYTNSNNGLANSNVISVEVGSETIATSTKAKETVELKEPSTVAVEVNEDESLKESESGVVAKETVNPPVQKKENLSISQRAGTDVTNWDEFVAAIADATVSTINVKQDLIRGSGAVPGTITRSLTINGEGHLIDFNANNGSIVLGSTSDATLVLTNMTVNKLGNTSIINASAANSKNWKIELSDIQSSESIVSGFITAENASVFIRGGTSTYNLASNNTVIVAKDFVISEGAIINSTVPKKFYSTEIADSKITIDGGSKVTVHSESGIALSMDARTDFTVSDPETLLKVTGNSNATGDAGAVMNFIGDKTTINVLDKAEVNVHSTRTVAILMNSAGGIFNVSGGAKLNLQSDNNANNLGSTLRFRLSGNMTFNVTDKAEININKTGGNAAAVRMYGKDNKFNVLSGGKVKIHNAGNGKPDDGGDGGNQGIHFTSGNGGLFNLMDKDSEVEIEADNGPAIDMGTNAGEIKSGPGTIFVAEGKTSSEKTGIFISGVSQVSVDKPLFYDFRNNREKGGNVFSNRNGSTFTSTQSDLSVWHKGENLDGDPSKNWSLFDYQLSGASFTKIDSTNFPDEFNTTSESYGDQGAAAYSRMSGNNATPVVDELRMPTNADKSLFGHVTIPVGSDDGRDAWTNEAYVVVEVTKPNGDIKEYTGVTIGKNNGSPGLEIYGEEARAGMYKITLADDAFVETGDKIKVVRAWRGSADPDSGRVHESTPEQLIAPERISKDVTPPSPSKINGVVTNASKQISGEKAEPGSQLTLLINDQEFPQPIEIEASGQWTYNLPNYLEKGDVVQVLLRDKAGLAEGVDNPPKTNNQIGNSNPTVTTDYHDATFEEGTKIIVGDILPDNNQVVKSVTVDNPENETHVGSILTFKLELSNNKENVETNWKNVKLSDVLDPGIDANLASVTLNGNSVPQESIQFDDKTRELSIKVGDIKTGEKAIVTFDAKVNIKAKDQTIKNIGKGIGESPREEVFVEGPEIPESAHQLIEVESNSVESPGGPITGGTLEFISAPGSLSFGDDLKLSPNNKVYSLKEYDSELAVLDNRISGGWSMVARVQKPMTGASGKVLDGALRYYINGQDNEMSEASIAIYDAQTQEDEIKISNNWKELVEGPMLNVRAGQAKAESYSGSIEWELQDVPGNDLFIGDL